MQNCDVQLASGGQPTFLLKVINGSQRLAEESSFNQWRPRISVFFVSRLKSANKEHVSPIRRHRLCFSRCCSRFIARYTV